MIIIDLAETAINFILYGIGLFMFVMTAIIIIGAYYISKDRPS